MLPSCGNATEPIPVATLVEPSTTSGSRPGKEDEVLGSEVSNNSGQGFAASAANAAAAVFYSK